jgi:hypothetical protein
MKCFAIVTILIVLAAGSVLAADTTAAAPFRSAKSTVGITLGTPAAINVFGTYYFNDNYGLRVSGGFLPSIDDPYIWGAQLNLLYRWHETEHGIAEASILFGTAELERNYWEFDSWRYFGISLSGRWLFLFGEAGLTYFSRSSNPNNEHNGRALLLQVGVVLFTVRSN